MIIEPSTKTHPSRLLALLVLAVAGCTDSEPGTADDPSDGSGHDESGTTTGPSVSTTDETDSVDTSSGGSESDDATASDSGLR